MSVDISGQITAIATAALAVFAIVTAAFAFLAYRKQAQEVGLLLEQNERETAKRRRAQAERIFIGAPLSAPSRPYAGNASDLPIFGAQIWVYDSRGLSIPEDLGIILPRRTQGDPWPAVH